VQPEGWWDGVTRITFTIPGTPCAQGRAKASTKSGRVIMYDPEKSRNYKAFAKYIASAVAPSTLLDGPISLNVMAVFPIPKSWPKYKQAKAREGQVFHIGKPDSDNIVKAVKDACSKVIWTDDARVCELVVMKVYGEVPRVEVSIAAMEVA
jgi:Holliday junction resolvase RusA-like endonuclease